MNVTLTDLKLISYLLAFYLCGRNCKWVVELLPHCGK